MKKGYFITLEGPEGAGKSTIIPAIKEALEKEWHNGIVTTREPGGSHIAEQIRHILLSVENTEMDARTEALLFSAARRQHLVDIVIPALDLGKIVICDRFVDSSLAYQGVARGIDHTDIWTINHFAIQGYLPDLTLLVDVPADLGLARIQAARTQDDIDRLDRESIEFHEKVRQSYLQLAQHSDRIKIIDGSLSIEQVIENALSIIKTTLSLS